MVRVHHGRRRVSQAWEYALLVEHVRVPSTRVAGRFRACPEVEAAIYEHENVLEVCVFGIPDTRLGEIVSCCIYLKPEAPIPFLAPYLFLLDKCLLLCVLLI